jgi:hypothetical protein
MLYLMIEQVECLNDLGHNLILRIAYFVGKAGCTAYCNGKVSHFPFVISWFTIMLLS